MDFKLGFSALWFMLFEFSFWKGGLFFVDFFRQVFLFENRDWLFHVYASGVPFNFIFLVLSVPLLFFSWVCFKMFLKYFCDYFKGVVVVGE